MRRKVIKQGNNTLTITLPKKWTETLGIKAGDELEFIETGDQLTLKSGKSTPHKRIVLEASKYKEALVRVVAAAYKAGYDEVEFVYVSPEELKTIQDIIIWTCSGFEIVEEGKNRVVIKAISKIEPGEFDALLRKIFLSLMSMADDSLSFMQKNDAVGIKTIALRDRNVNRYCDLCRRMLNKEAYGGRMPLYTIVEQLEKIGDLYKEISMITAKDSIKLDSKTINLFKGINLFMRDFYNLFYNFNIKGFEELIKNRDRNREMASACYSPEKMARIAGYLENISETVFSLNGPLLIMRIGSNPANL